MIDRFIGIDFSGAAQAGKAIWIAEARFDRGLPRIEACRPAAALPQSGSNRERCLPALVEFIASQRRVVVGCDFPFSLPAMMVSASTWRRFALDFADRFADPAAFLDDCRRRGNGRELKRACDRGSKVPFAAYNLRIYRQTFHGIRDVLAPLLRGGRATVLPMEHPSIDRPWVIETCPASTLKKAGLYISYKGSAPAARAARRRIIDGLVRGRLMATLPRALRQIAIDNAGGDALDGMIAALATARAYEAGELMEGSCDAIERIEGRVYF